MGLSWRLDRAGRVQAELILQSQADEFGDKARQAREAFEDATRRLIPNPGSAGSSQNAIPAGPDDPDDPARLVPRLERTADGCRWLLDRWAELRAIVNAGQAWDAAQMTRALRLLGNRPLDAADDPQVLAIVVACFALDRTRPDPFAVLWEGLSAREVERYRQRLLGRRLRDAMPASPDEARQVLLDVVNEAMDRLEELEATLRRRETEQAALRPAALLFDDTPEGRWVRARQSQYDHAIARIVERFSRARRKGEPMLVDPPPRVRARSKPTAPPTTPTPAPTPSRREEIAAARRQRGRKWRTHTVPPHRPPGGRQPSPKVHLPGHPRPRSRRRRPQTLEQIRQTARRFVRLFKWLGLLLLVAALAIAARSLSASPVANGQAREDLHTRLTTGKSGQPGSPIAVNLPDSRSSCPSCPLWLNFPSPELGRPATRCPDSGGLPTYRVARAGFTPGNRQNEPNLGYWPAAPPGISPDFADIPEPRRTGVESPSISTHCGKSARIEPIRGCRGRDGLRQFGVPGMRRVYDASNEEGALPGMDSGMAGAAWHGRSSLAYDSKMGIVARGGRAASRGPAIRVDLSAQDGTGSLRQPPVRPGNHRPMERATVANRWNLDLIEDYYGRWRQDPASVEESWRNFFEGYELAQQAGGPGAASVDIDAARRRRPSRGWSTPTASWATTSRTSTRSS